MKISPEETLLIYDGECPFCSEYVKLVRLRESIGPVVLVNARKDEPIVKEVIEAGFDLDEGMVLKYRGKLYHGADCIHMLALLSSPFGLFNRINHLIFKSEQLSRTLYPLLRSGRNLLLRLLRRKKINHSN